MTLQDYAEVLHHLDDLTDHYNSMKDITASFNFYDGSVSIYLESDLGFTFSSYHDFKVWYKDELLPALEGRENPDKWN